MTRDWNRPLRQPVGQVSVFYSHMLTLSICWKSGDVLALLNLLLFGATAFFWIVSLVWGVFTSLPHTLGATSSAAGTPLTSTLGLILYVVGLTFETLADVQKYQFKQSHPGQFCNVGVWSLSQHPNWFGNLALWSGIFLLNAPALIEPSKGGGSLWSRLWSARRLLVAVVSPLFLWTLFSGQANGSISSTVEMANKRYGSNPAYQEYVENVPLIFPNPLRWFTKN